MEYKARSGLRELQIARGLVALRWAAIPIFFGFGLSAVKLLGMTFRIAPIYVLCCIAAVVNVMYTLHISVLSRQLMLSRGNAALKRYVMRLLNRFMHSLKERGIRAFALLPVTILRLAASIYLMILEAMKDLAFNPLSMNNILHTQVINDIILILLFIRFTGAAESPFPIAFAIPVIVAAAVMGFFRGGVYAVASGALYLGLCLIVYFRLIEPVKFFSPAFGDLNGSLGWTISSFTMITVSLLGIAYLAHHLTEVFKERIYFLSHIHEQTKRDGITQARLADIALCTWLVTDEQGTVLKYHRGKIEFLPIQLVGENLFDAIPAFKQYGLGYVVQALLSGAQSRSVERIKIPADEGTVHSVSCRLYPVRLTAQTTHILYIVEDLTELLYLRASCGNLNKTLLENQAELDKVNLELRENNQQLIESLKVAHERAVAIEMLEQKLNEVSDKGTSLEASLTSLMDEIGTVKSENALLHSDLSYKQLILDELAELLEKCPDVESVASLIETKAKLLFKLDNVCLHVFSTDRELSRMNEILNTSKVSPRLLDMPRRNPGLLEPVLNEGQPVIIKAELRTDRTASMAISAGNMQRLIAYVPVRSGQETIGLMMFEKFGLDEQPEKLVEMLGSYLSHAAMALKKAIMSHEVEREKETLTEDIRKLETDIESLFDLIGISNRDPANSFKAFLQTLGRLTGAVDGAVVRLKFDGMVELIAKIDPARSATLNNLEEKILKMIMANPSQKVSIKLESDSSILSGYPLKQSGRLLGVLFVKLTEENGRIDGICDIVALLGAKNLALVVYNEEKELWDTFYKQNLSA